MSRPLGCSPQCTENWKAEKFGFELLKRMRDRATCCGLRDSKSKWDTSVGTYPSSKQFLNICLLRQRPSLGSPYSETNWRSGLRWWLNTVSKERSHVTKVRKCLRCS